jgi:flagellar P-ring protein FlgI
MVDNPFESSEYVVMNVRESDFTTTTAIVNAINKNFGDATARAIDGMSLAIRAPTNVATRGLHEHGRKPRRRAW